MVELEELKKRFLVEDAGTIEQDKLAELLERILPLAVVDRSGFVSISQGDMALRDKIQLVLSARYLAHALEEAVPVTVSVDELVRMLREESKIVSARCSELEADGFLTRPGRGVVQGRPFKVVDFIQNLPKQESH